MRRFLLSLPLTLALLFLPFPLQAQSSDKSSSSVKKSAKKNKKHSKKYRKKHSKKYRKKHSKKHSKKYRKKHSKKHYKKRTKKKRYATKKPTKKRGKRIPIKHSTASTIQKKHTPSPLSSLVGWSTQGGFTLGLTKELPIDLLISVPHLDMELSAFIGLGGGDDPFLETNAYSINALFAYKIVLSHLTFSLKAGPAMRHYGTAQSAETIFYNYGAGLTLDLQKRGKIGLSYYADFYAISYSFAFKN